MGFLAYMETAPFYGNSSYCIRSKACITKRDGAFVETIGIIRAYRKILPDGYLALTRIV